MEPNVGRKIAKQEMAIFPQETSMQLLKKYYEISNVYTNAYISIGP